MAPLSTTKLQPNAKGLRQGESEIIDGNQIYLSQCEIPVVRFRRKLADFVALSRDLFTIDPVEIPSVDMMLTVVGGQVMYRAD